MWHKRGRGRKGCGGGGGAVRRRVVVAVAVRGGATWGYGGGGGVMCPGKFGVVVVWYGCEVAGDPPPWGGVACV